MASIYTDTNNSTHDTEAIEEKAIDVVFLLVYSAATCGLVIAATKILKL